MAPIPVDFGAAERFFDEKVGYVKKKNFLAAAGNKFKGLQSHQTGRPTDERFFDEIATIKKILRKNSLTGLKVLDTGRRNL